MFLVLLLHFSYFPCPHEVKKNRQIAACESKQEIPQYEKKIRQNEMGSSQES